MVNEPSAPVEEYFNGTLRINSASAPDGLKFRIYSPERSAPCTGVRAAGFPVCVCPCKAAGMPVPPPPPVPPRRPARRRYVSSCASTAFSHAYFSRTADEWISSFKSASVTRLEIAGTPCAAAPSLIFRTTALTCGTLPKLACSVSMPQNTSAISSRVSVSEGRIYVYSSPSISARFAPVPSMQ